MFSLMNHDTTLYKRVIEVTEDYLGPAAQRFVDRQITNHLDKSPQQLSTQDLPTLIDWTKAAIALLTEDTKLVKEFSTRLKLLTDKSNSSDSA